MEKHKSSVTTDDNGEHKPKKLKEVLVLPGIKTILFAFLAYCTVEATAFSWTSSYLALGKGMPEEEAAKYVSLFYLGMTLSRLITGFFSDKLGDKALMRLGYGVTLVGILLMLFPFGSNAYTISGLFIAGFGCGPIYPAVIHATPESFGKDNSQAVVGVEMAFAYTGSTFLPPIFGLIANSISVSLFPAFLLLFILLGLVMTEITNSKTRIKNEK